LLEAVEASEARLKRKRERNRERESFFFSEKSFSENGAKLLPHHPAPEGGLVIVESLVLPRYGAHYIGGNGHNIRPMGPDVIEVPVARGFVNAADSLALPLPIAAL
jgi:hypothetical protein